MQYSKFGLSPSTVRREQVLCKFLAVIFLKSKLKIIIVVQQITQSFSFPFPNSVERELRPAKWISVGVAEGRGGEKLRDTGWRDGTFQVDTHFPD